jgi:RimJ/RimL family protein N-acetyltransferase
MSHDLQTPYVVGEHVYLRPLDMEDAEAVIVWINSAEVSQTLSFRWPMSRHQQEDYIQSLYTSQTEMTLGVCLKVNNRLIGCAGLHGIKPVNRLATLGLVIGEVAEWGKGYGTDAARLIIDVAFERLNLRRLELDVEGYNPAAKRVYEKLGFRVEGVRRQHTYRAGAYNDD